jgi:Ca-activated chloride channel family protein
MTFMSPARLLLLLLVAGFAAAYLWAQRRRSAYAVRFTELELLASVAPRSPAGGGTCPPACCCWPWCC